MEAQNDGTLSSPRHRWYCATSHEGADFLLGASKRPPIKTPYKKSRKVVASQIVIFLSIQILNSLLGSLKLRAYLTHLGIQKGPQIKIWLATRPVGAVDLTVVYAARPHPVARR